MFAKTELILFQAKHKPYDTEAMYLSYVQKILIRQIMLDI